MSDLTQVRSIDMLRELIRRQPKGFMTIPEGKQVTITTRDLLNQKADSEDVDDSFVGVRLVILTSHNLDTIMKVGDAGEDPRV